MINAYIKYTSILDGHANIQLYFLQEVNILMEIRVLRYFLAVAREESISEPPNICISHSPRSPAS